MKKKALWPLLFGVMVVLAGCDYSKPENRDGFFYNTFVKPMDNLIHLLGANLDHNYGLAIIIITLIVRLVLFPFMMKTYKNQKLMREKMKLAKPEMEKIQERVKRARTQEEKMEANQDMMALYKKHGINPMNMGCLPIVIQMPIVMGLFYVLKFPTEGGITEYPQFLWFNLTQPDIFITIIAGIIYALQAFVSMKYANVPDEQKNMMRMMMFISPIMIIWMSYISASALGLYWAVGGAFLVVQTWLGNVFYNSKVEEEMKPIIEAHEKNQQEANNDKKPAKLVSNKKKKK